MRLDRIWKMLDKARVWWDVRKIYLYFVKEK